MMEGLAPGGCDGALGAAMEILQTTVAVYEFGSIPPCLEAPRRYAAWSTGRTYLASLPATAAPAGWGTRV